MRSFTQQMNNASYNSQPMIEFVREYSSDFEFTGKILPRDEAHEKGLWHEVVHIWYVNERSTETLFQVRSREKQAYKNIRHVSVADHITADEDAFTTSP